MANEYNEGAEGAEGSESEHEEGAEGAEEADESAEEEGSEKQPTSKRRTPQEELNYFEGRAKRLRKELGLDGDQPSKATQPTNKSGELDYGQKAYLVASGIKGSEEIGLVKEFMKNTGKSLDEVIESKFFQGELKDLRETNASRAAMPKGAKRSGQTARDSVDYWIAKGELPPADQVELRRAVVNAKMKAETSGNPFSSNPVVR